MEEHSIRLCRTCGKKNHIFCNVNHEVVQKLLKFIPGLLDKYADQTLPNDICVDCYQMIRTLVFNIEGIKDMQRILVIQNAPKLQNSSPDRKRSLVDDITRKYSDIKVRKISVHSPEKPAPKPSEPKLKTQTKIVIVEETPKVPKIESPKQLEPAQRSFMCISCSEKFQKFTQLEIHIKSCKTSSNQQFKCFCGKVLSSKQELSKHVSMQHKQNKRHICSVCQKVVTSLSNLQNHMIMAHKSPQSSIKGIYMCHVCNSKHLDIQGLKNHRLNCKGKTNES